MGGTPVRTEGAAASRAIREHPTSAYGLTDNARGRGSIPCVTARRFSRDHMAWSALRG